MQRKKQIDVYVNTDKMILDDTNKVMVYKKANLPFPTHPHKIDSSIDSLYIHK
jgi:hypothetical protein